MPRYYFHLHNDIDAPDADGVELLSLEAAREHAAGQIRVTFAETVKDLGRVVLHHRSGIENAGGDVLASVQFGEAVRVEE